MNVLFDEIMLRIFSYVQPKCRRETVSLVCKRWNRLANDRQFLDDDEIVLYEDAPEIRAITTYLAACERRTFNIHCTGSNFSNPLTMNEYFYAFGRLCGAKISSLVLDNRNLTLDAFKSILELCPNLRKLSLILEDFANALFENHAAIENLNLKIPSVSSFHFARQCTRTIIDDLVLLKLLSVFPNLTELTLTLTYNDDQSLPDGRTHFPLTGLYDYIEFVAKNLNKLRLFVELNYSRPLEQRLYEEFVKKLDASGRVKVFLNVRLKVTEIPRTFAPSTIANKIITLKACSLNDSTISGNFVLHLLECCPNLADLCLNAASPTNFDAAVMKQILESRLKTLQLDFKTLSGDIDPTIVGNFRPNCSLKDLTIRGSHPWITNLWTSFLSHLRNLRHITVGWANDVILQNIFKHQKHLKTLSLERCNDCTDFGFTGQSDNEEPSAEIYSIRELKELQYFKMCYASSIRLSTRSFSSFILPELKTLLVDFSEPDVHIESVTYSGILKCLTETLLNSPNLEAFESISYEGFDYYFHEITPIPPAVRANRMTWLQTFVTESKCLRYFHLYDTNLFDDFDELEARELFNQSQSLRSLRVDTNTFLYNVYTTEIERFDHGRQYFFKKRSIFVDDSSSLDWRQPRF